MEHTVEEIKAHITGLKRQYAAGLLSKYKIRKLEEIPGWTWEFTAKEQPTYKAESKGVPCGHKHKSTDAAVACGVRTFHGEIYRVDLDR